MRQLPSILNFCVPWPTFPLMSVAVHLKVVVSVRWKTWPGSRGPVESHSGDDAVGVAWVDPADPPELAFPTDRALLDRLARDR